MVKGGGVTFADVHQFYRDLAAAVTPLPVVAYVVVFLSFSFSHALTRMLIGGVVIVEFYWALTYDQSR